MNTKLPLHGWTRRGRGPMRSAKLAGGVAVGAGHSNIYVCGLPRDIDVTGVQNLFEQHGCGAIVSLRHVPWKQCAFLKYKSVGEAQQAVERMDGRRCARAMIGVRAAAWDYRTDEAVPSDKIYVQGLRARTTENELRACLNAYGIVLEVRVMVRRTRVAGLIRMGSVEQAALAIERLNGRTLHGPDAQPLAVRFASPRPAAPPSVVVGVVGAQIWPNRGLPLCLDVTRAWTRLFSQLPRLTAVLFFLVAFCLGFSTGRSSFRPAGSLTSLLLAGLPRKSVTNVPLLTIRK